MSHTRTTFVMSLRKDPQANLEVKVEKGFDPSNPDFALTFKATSSQSDLLVIQELDLYLTPEQARFFARSLPVAFFLANQAESGSGRITMDAPGMEGL